MAFYRPLLLVLAGLALAAVALGEGEAFAAFQSSLPHTLRSVQGGQSPLQQFQPSRQESVQAPWTVRGVAYGCGCMALLGLVSSSRGRRTSVRAVRTTLRAVANSVPEGNAVKLFSPAKVNLFLRIIRRREDGYHDLASLFHTVAFGDTLELKVLPDSAEKDELRCNLPGVPVDESNLVIRALKLFREKSGVQRFFDVNLEKTIPAQAGMGGGSSNAATAFFGANLLCGSPATPEELLQWGDDPVIGSDATFFLSEGTAYCTGRGEIVTPVGALPIPPGKSVYLVKPKYGLSTPSVFKALDLSALSTVDPEELLNTFKEKGTSHSSWVNDLEKPAFIVSPELGELKKFLSGADLGFEAVLMSGSGSTIYCIGEPNGGAEAFKAATKEKFEIEGIWRTELMRRASPTAWYSEAA
eukprot:gb/GFBE01019636.1/.p1 GENE.gb/GFBE01019636.1/~~gb/GFBE01019636.1/.p1  ORF type:complete len:413 (+),score=82.16 gb/GFBE01019636.1/:1-1239(+)